MKKKMLILFHCPLIQEHRFKREMQMRFEYERKLIKQTGITTLEFVCLHQSLYIPVAK